MPGTREPRHLDNPFQYSTTQHYHRITAGYHKKHNKSAGISRSLHKSRFSLNDIRQIAFPTTPQLQGRALAVCTVRGHNLDITYIGAYFPPQNTDTTTTKLYKDLHQWLLKLLLTLPARTTHNPTHKHTENVTLYNPVSVIQSGRVATYTKHSTNTTHTSLSCQALENHDT
jgi:hypothetical protein